ncbi:MAG: hypothetical protein EBY28_04725 [Betaproteobacteria bacterium]|nr:hypothetical protein [Betaproteobacteria bacterium]
MTTPIADFSPALPTEPTWRQRLASLDSPYVVPVFITMVLVVGQLSFGFLESASRTFLAISVAIGVELLLGRLLLGKWQHPASAYVSGISVGILVRSPAFWPFALCAALSICSKYVLRYRGRHLWNPSNFGISALLFLGGEMVGSLSIQWGNHVWAMLVIWVLGAFIIWRLRRFHITATYVLAFICYAGLRSWYTGATFESEISPVTGPMYQLFIFFMITDPKTTVKTRRGQCLVAFAVATVEAVLRLAQVVYAPYYALFFVGPTALMLETWWAARSELRDASAAPVGSPARGVS